MLNQTCSIAYSYQQKENIYIKEEEETAATALSPA